MSSKKWRKIKLRKSSATQILPDQKKKYSSKIWLKYYRFLVYKWCTYHLCHWASFRARRVGRELSSARHSLVNNMCLIWFFWAFLRGAALRDWRRDMRNLFHIRDLMSACAHTSVNFCCRKKKRLMPNWGKKESWKERKKTVHILNGWTLQQGCVCYLSGSVLLTAVKLMSNPGYLMQKYKLPKDREISICDPSCTFPFLTTDIK